MTAAIPADATRADDWHELKLLWVSLVQRPWASLAVVPTEAPLSSRDVGVALSEIGGFHDVAQIETMHALGISSGEGLRLARHLAERVALGKRVVVLVDPLTQSMAGFPLVTAAERAVLAIRYGSSLASAQATVDLIGRGKVLGAVAFPPAR